MSQATQPDPRIGTTLNERYQITRQIGEGGMGVVYEGQHLLIQKRVAIKMLHAQFATSPEVVARFRREAIAATSIRHPHIVEVMDLGTAPDGAMYMVLEFLEGRDWSDDIEKTGAQPLGKVARILMAVCEGLGAAHDRKIVHRDLKAENVFLAKHGREHDFVKIVDFGISKILDEPETSASHNLTKTGAAMGTPYAMAPEQLKGAKDVDHRADLWAIGVMAYRALTNHYPFDGETFPLLAVNVLTGEAPPLARFRSDLPVGVQAVVSKLLAKNRDERFQSAAEVREAFARFEAIDTAPSTTTQPAGIGLAATMATPMPATNAVVTAIPQGTPTPALVSPTAIHAPAGAVTPSLLGAAPVPPASSGRLGVIVGAIGISCLLVAGGAVAWLSLGPAAPPPVAAATAPPPPAEPPPPAAVVPTTAAVPSGAGTVRVQITTDPEDAELLLDGQPVPNPFDADLPSSTEVHRIEARAPGRVTEVREVSLAFPQRLRIELPRATSHVGHARPEAHAEPTHTEPAHTEPAHTEPAHTEPAHTEPAHSEPTGRPGLSNPFGP